ncbi:hypothetical protein K6V98_07670 [Collinsella sp. AGMB00827]|uniref:Uncharacterized protein n=1 Tax=Collinsella ureilytica TaxID=2869515 RepID=A0ABS7MLG7_9ACTN|nr:hypothetical protein [Collinsella urealyticum]MBY4798222.1 hypothetical protein [Collinsella urealyticum]
MAKSEKKSQKTPEEKCTEIMQGIDAYGFDIPDDVRAQIERQITEKTEDPIDIGRFTKEFFAFSGVSFSQMGVSILLSIV